MKWIPMVAILFVAGCSANVERDYKKSVSLNTPETYVSFIKECSEVRESDYYFEGRIKACQKYVPLAFELYNKIFYDRISDSEDIDDFEKFITEQYDSSFAKRLKIFFPITGEYHRIAINRINELKEKQSENERKEIEARKEREKNIEKKPADPRPLSEQYRSGDLEIKTAVDAEIAFKASPDYIYQFRPKLNFKENEYFSWECTNLVRKIDDLYICWDTERGGLQGPFGFAFRIEKSFVDLQYYGWYKVVGKYNENTEIILVSGETRPIAVLNDAYVFGVKN